MRFLFTTLQEGECDFYGRVGEELSRRGHEVAHITYSRKAAGDLADRGLDARCLLDSMPSLSGPDSLAEARRIESTYPIPSIRDVYRTDPPCEARSEEWCVSRTVKHFLALEHQFDDLEPDILVPEVGNELIRTVAHLVALDRGVQTVFLFYTLFPRPLRLCIDSMRAPLLDPGAIGELTAAEREDLEEFRNTFIARAEPIRAYRRADLSRARVQRFVSRSVARLTSDRENEYLRPVKWATENVHGWFRRLLARSIYQQTDEERPFVYFPLHEAHDYKIKRLAPHCFDQSSIIEQIAEALPPGYDLVVKEHPMSLGRNSIGFLRRLRRPQNVRLVDSYTSSHELIQRSTAIVVIGSTVGLEALLYAKPVLTLGRPFYSGYGVTLDLDSFAEITEGIPSVLRFRPDPELIDRFLAAAMGACWPGKPVLVDSSDENALALAASLDGLTVRRSGSPSAGVAPAAVKLI